MFVDGIWYATISRNLSEGLGSFWSPYFTKTMFPVFNEQPPLVFGIQSFFFKLLGDSWYVEKIYSFFIIFLTLILINNLWKVLFKDSPELKRLGFIPCILWILTESTYIFYPNDLLECTQGIFVLISVILVLKAIKDENSISYFYIFLSGISLIGSFLSKGFTGIYPLIAIIIYYLIFRNIPLKKVIIYNVILFCGFSLILLLYFLNQNAANNINNYLTTQVIAALKGERTENMHLSRFYIIKRLVQTSILPLSLVIITTLISFFKYGVKNIFKFKKYFLFFIILGLSSVIPMMISKKQATYYLLTTTPYFSIALSLIFIRNKLIINNLKKSMSFRLITFSILIFSLIFSLFSVDKINKRDKFVLNDLEQFKSTLKDKSTIGCITEKKENSLYGYFMRIYSVSLDTINPYNYSLLVCDVESKIDTANYTLIILKTKKYSLYRKKKFIEINKNAIAKKNKSFTLIANRKQPNKL